MILSVREKSKEKRRDARGKGVEEHYLGLGFHKEGAIYNMTESLVPVIFPRQAQERKTKPLKYNCPLPQNIIQVNVIDSQEEMETKVRQSLSGMLDEMAADIARMVPRVNGNISGGEIA
jgi:hypothetical protein